MKKLLLLLMIVPMIGFGQNEVVPEIHKRNIFIILVNQQDKILYGIGSPTKRGKINEDGSISSSFKDDIKAFVINFGKDSNSSESPNKAIVSLQCSNKTSYNMYLQVQNEITKAYNELRNEKSNIDYRKDFNKLDDEEQKIIKNYYPMRISEAEPITIIPPPPPPEEIEIVEMEDLVNELEVEYAETDEEEMIEEEEGDDPYISVEQMPRLGKCGDDECTTHKIMKFIAKNFRYPEISKAHGVEGRVILEFVVEKDGTVGRVKILRGINPNLYRNLSKEEEEDLRETLDLNKEELQTWINNTNNALNNECIRVVRSMPKFIPGKQLGKAVPVKYTVPIKCTLG